MKKIFCLGISIITMLSMTFSGQTASAESSTTNINQDEALSIYGDLINKFDEEVLSKEDVIVYTFKDNNDNLQNYISPYPDDYAGAYYSDSGELHIMLTEPTNIKTYHAKTNDDRIQYDIVKNSYNDLKVTQLFLDNYMISYDIITTYIDEKENTLFIEVASEDIKTRVENLLSDNGFDINIVKFIVDEKQEIILTSFARTGDKIVVDDDDKGTIGFNAYNPATQKYGIVTAYHVTMNY